MSDDFRLQHSVKTRDGDMLNVRGATPDEFEAALGYAEKNIERIVTLGALARAVGTAQDAGLLPNQQPPTSFTGGGQVSGWGQQATPQQSAPGPTCAHGPMILKTGNKNGKNWSGHFCPGPRGSQCDPVWPDKK